LRLYTIRSTYIGFMRLSMASVWRLLYTYYIGQTGLVGFLPGSGAYLGRGGKAGKGGDNGQRGLMICGSHAARVGRMRIDRCWLVAGMAVAGGDGDDGSAFALMTIMPIGHMPRTSS